MRSAEAPNAFGKTWIEVVRVPSEASCTARATFFAAVTGPWPAEDVATMTRGLSGLR